MARHEGHDPHSEVGADAMHGDNGGGHDGAGKQHEGHGQGNHDHHSPAMFRDRLLIVVLLTIPVLAYSADIQSWFGFEPPAFPGSDLLTFILGLAIYVYGGQVFIKGAADELRSRLPGMMTLISLAITVAFAYSAAVTFGFPGKAIYWELSTLVAIMLLGHWVEMGSVSNARGAMEELASLLPDTASRLTDSGVEEVQVNELSEGDVVLIRPGGRIPADGIVIEGSSKVDESMLTGESVPIDRSTGDEVIAGTVNMDGSLRVRVEKVDKETALAGIMRMVKEAQESSSRSQALADRAAFYLTVIAISAAIITAIAWTIAGEESAFVIERVVTVLVMTCPHALGLAIPLVIAISVTLAARNGLLVKDRKALEDAKDIDCVVFDKTGTLTKGEQTLTSIDPVNMDSDRLLGLAAAAEADSEHMLSKAIVSSAEERGLTIPAAKDFQNHPGKGVSASVDGLKVNVGGPHFLEDMGLERYVKEASEGQGLIYVVVDGEFAGTLTIADDVRQESEEAVASLNAMGIKVMMITGDSESVSKKVAERLGIDHHFSQVLPADKSSRIKDLREQGYTVAMVGDGVNDAPALAAADLGIAIGAGTDVAVESAGIVLLRNDPRDVVRLIRLSRATYRKMLQNLAWATGYNVIAIPLAAGVLAGIGFLMPMAAGALLMSASTVIVALNAQLLRSFDVSATRPGL